MKKFLSVLLVMAIVLSMSSNAFANSTEDVTIDYIDQLLRAANTPEEQIEAMDDDLKRLIYENSLSNNDVEYIDVTKEQTADSMARSGDQISESDLVLRVTAYKVSGQDQVDIYPYYQWLTPVRPKGKDCFSYLTHSSYSIVQNKKSNAIYVKEQENHSWQHAGSATYTGISFTGYEHKGPSLGTPDIPIYIKGQFYFRVDIDVDNPVKKIILAYVHDTSSGGNVSYGISYGGLSISVTPSSNNVSYLNNVFVLNY